MSGKAVSARRHRARWGIGAAAAQPQAEHIDVVDGEVVGIA